MISCRLVKCNLYQDLRMNIAEMHLATRTTQMTLTVQLKVIICEKHVISVCNYVTDFCRVVNITPHPFTKFNID